MASDEEKIVMMVVILVIAIVTIYIELRIRKIGVGKKVTSSKLKKDRAFNSLHTTKAVRNKLRIDRVDTMKADYMISKAETAFEDNDYDSCIDLCKDAREQLLLSKREVSAPIAELPAGSKARQADATQNETIKSPSVGIDNTALLQAKFELKAAKTDLEAFSGDSDVRQKASQLVAEAERQLASSDYQKSLSAAFRARKLMSGEAMEEKPPAKEAEGAGMQGEEPKSKDLKCESCMAVNEPDDIFCHSCGKQLKSSKCASCGAELKGYEKFCRRCGKAAQ